MVLRELQISVTRMGVRRKWGGVEGMERKFNGNYLRLIPGLCLEDKIKLLCVYVCLSSGDVFIFSVRVSSFIS
jgi:hypothetical protein